MNNAAKKDELKKELLSIGIGDMWLESYNRDEASYNWVLNHMIQRGEFLASLPEHERMTREKRFVELMELWSR